MQKDLIILAIYIDTEGRSRHQSDQMMHEVFSMYKDLYDDTNKDVKVYYFPSNETKVECIYPPPNIIGDNSSFVENELLKIYKLFINSKDGESKELIQHIERKLKLNKVTTKK